MTILPMLCSPTSTAGNRRPLSFLEIMATGSWVADTKMDGVRGLIHWNRRDVTITNRTGVNITYRYPEVVADLTRDLKGIGSLIIDGEIVANSASFEDTLRRDQQEDVRKINALATSMPCRLVAFDLPENTTPWIERRQKLQDLLGDRLTLTTISTDAGFLDQTRELGMEGVVAKHVNGRYEFGKRSKMWLKYRNRYRVTCLIAGYLPGNGSRAEFGSMILALLGPSGDVIEVGRVGTGFKASQIPMLMKALAAGDLLVAEIETTNQTSSGQLRFPVFRGLRSDVAPQDCTTEQLRFLPTM